MRIHKKFFERWIPRRQHQHQIFERFSASVCIMCYQSPSWKASSSAAATVANVTGSVVPLLKMSKMRSRVNGFRANAKLFLKRKKDCKRKHLLSSDVFMSTVQANPQPMSTRKQKWRDKLVRKREGKAGEKKVKSRCVRWQNAKAHTRDYPPNEEEYPSQLGVWGPPTSQLASAHIF